MLSAHHGGATLGPYSHREVFDLVTTVGDPQPGVGPKADRPHVPGDRKGMLEVQARGHAKDRPVFHRSRNNTVRIYAIKDLDTIGRAVEEYPQPLQSMGF